MASKRQHSGPTDLKPDALAEALTRAAELVKDLPQDLRNTAFAKAFDILLGAAPGHPRQVVAPASPEGRPRPHQPTSVRAEPNDAADHLIRTLDRTQYPEIHTRSKVLDQCLIVLRAGRDAGVEWLSPSDLLRVLKDKFRVSAQPGAIRMALSRAARLTDRRPAGSGFEYRIMSAGDAYLDGSAEDRSPKPNRAKRPRAAPLSRDSDQPSHDVEPKPIATKATRSSSRSPTRLLDDLIVAGFFNQPRTIGEIGEHLAHKKAVRYKSSDLSPILTRLVRTGRIDREKSEGQYVYRAHVPPQSAPDPYLEGIMGARK